MSWNAVAYPQYNVLAQYLCINHMITQGFFQSIHPSWLWLAPGAIEIFVLLVFHLPPCLPAVRPTLVLALGVWLQIFHTTKVIMIMSNLRNCCSNEDSSTATDMVFIFILNSVSSCVPLIITKEGLVSMNLHLHHTKTATCTCDI